jgi:hypothetical protein
MRGCDRWDQSQRKALSKRKKGKKNGVTFDMFRQIALSLPGVEEGTLHQTPAYRVKGKLVARLREDGESLVVRANFDEREKLMKAHPNTFYITDHYRNYPAILIDLSSVRVDQIRQLFEQAWRSIAGKRLVAAYDQQRLIKDTPAEP